MTIPHPLPDLLPEVVLARRAALPLKPGAVTLDGHFVRLELYAPDAHLDALYAASDGRAFTLGDRQIAAYDPDALIWRWMHAGPFATRDAFDEYMAAQVNAPDGLPFAVIDRTTGQPVGVANYLANAPAHLKIELGSIWYSPAAQRTAANTETTYLLLRHAFDLGYQRLEWKCNARNERSRLAALRLGFTFEGVQQAHMIIKGRRRDTAWFRMLADEWPAIRAALETRLYMP
jgi:RimJ/RimL family protein N-acetyltransferase